MPLHKGPGDIPLSQSIPSLFLTHGLEGPVSLRPGPSPEPAPRP